MEADMKELEALLEYLVKHNEDHAEELMGLAVRARSLGMAETYEHLIIGVEQMNGSNESLRAALEALRG